MVGRNLAQFLREHLRSRNYCRWFTASLQLSGHRGRVMIDFVTFFELPAKNRERKNCGTRIVRYLRRPLRDLENRSTNGNPHRLTGIIVGLALVLAFSLARQLQRTVVEMDTMARRTIKPSPKRVVKRRGSQRIEREIAILQATIKLLQERIRVLEGESTARGPRV